MRPARVEIATVLRQPVRRRLGRRRRQQQPSCFQMHDDDLGSGRELKALAHQSYAFIDTRRGTRLDARARRLIHATGPLGDVFISEKTRELIEKSAAFVRK
jgi:hypothetical protein